MDRRLPGFEPAYLRLELEQVPGEGWALYITEADNRRFVSAADRDLYGVLGWHDALQICGDVLDAINPRGGAQEPF